MLTGSLRLLSMADSSLTDPSKTGIHSEVNLPTNTKLLRLVIIKGRTDKNMTVW